MCCWENVSPERCFPDVDPIGRSFTFDKEQFNVIGVVREIHHPSVDPHVDRPEIYTAFSGVGGYSLNIRCRNACPDTALVRQKIRAAHPALTVNDADALEDLYFEQLAQPRAVAALGFTFAAIAVLAAAAGLFSVLTYAVGRRKREFGIRTALGASPAQIQSLVIRDGLVVALDRRRDRRRGRLVARSRHCVVPVRRLAQRPRSAGPSSLE